MQTGRIKLTCFLYLVYICLHLLFVILFCRRGFHTSIVFVVYHFIFLVHTMFGGFFYCHPELVSWKRFALAPAARAGAALVFAWALAYRLPLSKNAAFSCLFLGRVLFPLSGSDRLSVLGETHSVKDAESALRAKSEPEPACESKTGMAKLVSREQASTSSA